jgi:large subunit ribosomal protein L10
MRQEKELLLNEIKTKIDASTAMIVAQYDRLAPNVSWKLRDQLAKSGSLFEVVQKRVFVKAAEKAGMSIDVSELKGHIGVVFVNQPDAMPATKLIYKFSEENGNIFHVLFGQMEGKSMPAADLEVLSKLPSMLEMRASLLGLFVSPMSQMLAVLDAAMAGPMSAVDQES